jgi:hypothetical protein
MRRRPLTPGRHTAIGATSYPAKDVGSARNASENETRSARQIQTNTRTVVVVGYVFGVVSHLRRIGVNAVAGFIKEPARNDHARKSILNFWDTGGTGMSDDIKTGFRWMDDWNWPSLSGGVPVSPFTVRVPNDTGGHHKLDLWGRCRLCGETPKSDTQEPESRDP